MVGASSEMRYRVADTIPGTASTSGRCSFWYHASNSSAFSGDDGFDSTRKMRRVMGTPSSCVAPSWRAPAAGGGVDGAGDDRCMSTSIQTDRAYRLLIDGQWVETADTYAIVNPANEEVVGLAPEATKEQAEAAAAAARRAFDSWSQTTREYRAGLLAAAAKRLRERAAEIVPVVQAETGSLISVATNVQV